MSNISSMTLRSSATRCDAWGTKHALTKREFFDLNRVLGHWFPAADLGVVGHSLEIRQRRAYGGSADLEAEQRPRARLLWQRFALPVSRTHWRRPSAARIA